MSIWPTADSFTRKDYRSPGITMCSFSATCDFDGYDKVDIIINTTGGIRTLDGCYLEILRDLDLLQSYIPKLLDFLAEPSAWSFSEIHGIDVMPDEVVRRPVGLSVSINRDRPALNSRSVSVDCLVDDSFDVEPNCFFIELDECGNVLVAQLND